MINFLIRLFVGFFHWSIVGKKIKVYHAEGPEKDIFKDITGTVTSCDETSGSQQIKVLLDKPVLINGELLNSIFLLPRHKNYESSSLIALPIAVIVVKEIRVNDSSVLAMAMLKAI